MHLLTATSKGLEWPHYQKSVWFLSRGIWSARRWIHETMQLYFSLTVVRVAEPLPGGGGYTTLLKL